MHIRDFNKLTINSGDMSPHQLMRSSFSLKELEVRPLDQERQNLNKFLQCIKVASPVVFKEIKQFIYYKEKLPFCNEVYITYKYYLCI